MSITFTRPAVHITTNAETQQHAQHSSVLPASLSSLFQRNFSAIGFFLCMIFSVNTLAQEKTLNKSIRDFNVSARNAPEVNTRNLQKAIDWASTYGAALYVDPSDEPYAVRSGIVLKHNVSLIGVHGPTPRGTKHPL